MKRAIGLISLTLAAIVATGALAQQRPGVGIDKRWPGQSPEQGEDDAPPPEPRPGRAVQPTPGPPAGPVAAGSKPQPAPPRVIACAGVFAKDSSHVKLATFFGAQAVSWTQVAGPEGSKLNASVVFPKDPKRRLEVLWNSEASRSDTQVIVINGQSTWVGPNGLKLGMPIAAIEKLNKKPFSLKAFGGESGGSVTDWSGGALATLAGGCKVSVRFAPDPKSSTQAEADLLGDKEIQSSFPALRAVAPKVSEIILGY
jgi:hypothetical protein